MALASRRGDRRISRPHTTTRSLQSAVRVLQVRGELLANPRRFCSHIQQRNSFYNNSSDSSGNLKILRNVLKVDTLHRGHGTACAGLHESG